MIQLADRFSSRRTQSARIPHLRSFTLARGHRTRRRLSLPPPPPPSASSSLDTPSSHRTGPQLGGPLSGGDLDRKRILDPASAPTDRYIDSIVSSPPFDKCSLPFPHDAYPHLTRPAPAPTQLAFHSPTTWVQLLYANPTTLQL